MERSILCLADGRELAGGPGEVAVKSVRYTETVNAGEDLTLGSVCSCCLVATFFAPGDVLHIAAGSTLTYYTQDDTPDEDGVLPARRLVGTFTCEKPLKTGANTYSVTAYDAVVRLDVGLDDWLRGLDGWPYTLQTFAGMVCAACGLTLEGQLPAPARDWPVRRFFDSGLTGRALLRWVGEASACFCRATPKGAIRFGWYTPLLEEYPRTQLGPTAPPRRRVVRLTGEILRTANDRRPKYRVGVLKTHYPYLLDSLVQADYQPVIQRVQIRHDADDVGVIYPADTVGNTYVIEGNLLLATDSDAALRPLAEWIYRRLAALRYTPCSLAVHAGHPVRAGHLVEVERLDGSVFTAAVMTRERRGQTDTLAGVGQPARDCASVTNTRALQDVRGKVLRLRTTVDGLTVENAELDGKIAMLALDVDGFKVEVGNSEAALEGRLNERMTSLSVGLNEFKVEIGETYAAKTELDGYTRHEEVRSRFAMDESSVRIESGEIAFIGNTLTVDSDNFKLTKDGAVQIKGSFESTAASGTQVKCYMDARGVFTASADGQRRGVWVKQGGDIAGVFGAVMAVDAQEGSEWGKTRFYANRSGQTWLFGLTHPESTLQFQMADAGHPCMVLQENATGNGMFINWVHYTDTDTYTPRLRLACGDGYLAVNLTPDGNLAVTYKKPGSVYAMTETYKEQVIELDGTYYKFWAANSGVIGIS